MVSFWKGFPPGWQSTALSLCPHQAGGDRSKFFGVSSSKGTCSPQHTAPTFLISTKQSHRPKAPSPNTITLRVRASAYEFGGGGHNSVHSKKSFGRLLGSEARQQWASKQTGNGAENTVHSWELAGKVWCYESSIWEKKIIALGNKDLMFNLLRHLFSSPRSKMSYWCIFPFSSSYYIISPSQIHI